MSFTASTAVTTVLPVSLLFWLNVFVYALHVLEESVLPEVFVDKMKRRYFPGYDWRKFFWFNASLLAANVLAVVIFESVGGSWIIFPTALLVERTLNGLWHFGETIATRRYSSGLLMSVVTWCIMYLLIRYSLCAGQISGQSFLIACLVGLGIDLIMMVPMYLGAFRRRGS